MKKKVLCALLVSGMVAGMLAGCGGGSSEPAGGEAPAAEAPAAEAPAAEEGSAPAEAGALVGQDEGKNLNIQVWNEEFKERLEQFYPGYEVVDATTGKIGEVTVNWTITPNDGNAYQNHLDEQLLAQADAADDEKVDIFLVEADYALKYTATDFCMPLSDLGITDADLADQFQYTKDVVTADGQLKGTSWQGCPGVMIYRRDIAEEVFGTQEPEEIQEIFSDWDKFAEAAKKLKDAGYMVTSSANDTFRTFSNNVTSKWVEDGKINIDENIMKWVDMSKEMVDAGETNTYDLWSDDWSKGFYEDSNVFCYFGPAWFIDFSMSCDQPGSVGEAGNWAATEGPQGFFWGGTWICAATGTDNPALVKDIMLQLTANPDIMTEIVKQKSDFVNNAPAMEAMAADESFGNPYLGGQNALGKFAAGVSTVDLSNISPYDQGCNEAFQQAMKNYFDGNASKEEALAQFEKAVMEKYPELAQ